MCGRFNVIDNPGLQQLLRDLGIDLNLPTRTNLAPTEGVPLVRADGPEHRLDSARWWLTPSWAPAVDQKYSMFNARAETLASSRAFRTPFRRQRGIVPMSSFIEWRTEGGGKQPWLIESGEGAFAAAALWDVWDGDGSALLTCSVVTTAAAEAFTPWHTRMPVFIAGEERDRWLDNTHPVASDDPLFQPRLKCDWRLVPLSREVSNARNKAPELMEAPPQAEVVHLARDG
ncbi:SOS response-associated peptidase [Mangrovimicrobium sediminis]|uniref:Abasic site processing protein n=1 Tax=Mangrovimicrobium sediminis TaxID=2562682 RepID=A0A4Z0LXQ9_9GAMM|nr:SOS response-associated peptidase [Haliea sp. SAOS-164]TGD72069.1 SOS response-associated peptidase [Haliea sp. SAOS-164]